jgi:hypothetical protein
MSIKIHRVVERSVKLVVVKMPYVGVNIILHPHFTCFSPNLGEIQYD